MDGDAETADTKPKEAESTNESPSQCTPTNFKDKNDKYQLACAECKRLVRDKITCRSTHPPSIQRKTKRNRLQSANLKCNSSLNSHEEDEANWKLERELKEQ